MISKHILSAPKNDNYARLANYIAAGHEYSMDIQNEERIYDPQRNVSASQGLAGNRLRQLSECRLASYSQREQKEKLRIFCLLMHALIDEPLIACEGTKIYPNP